MESAAYVAFVGDDISSVEAVEDFVGIECFHVVDVPLKDW